MIKHLNCRFPACRHRLLDYILMNTVCFLEEEDGPLMFSEGKISPPASSGDISVTWATDEAIPG